MLGLPDALYNCLKTTLAQGPEAIEGHLPLIKAAILKLLSAIKSKQSDQTRWDIYLAAQDRVKKVRVSRTELTREGLLALFRDWLGPLGRCSRLYILDSERNVQYELESMEDTIQPYSVISLRGKRLPFSIVLF
ncbi:hypothetical protein BY458DRAFT_307948 [Sporodiniella umbellata]|nr:hypothetical protein BY458DRAFT_307948 [Sporodiniella umbellata]